LRWRRFVSVRRGTDRHYADGANYANYANYANHANHTDDANHADDANHEPVPELQHESHPRRHDGHVP
jgi:hypothetical protein